jgi:hypothetical protein
VDNAGYVALNVALLDNLTAQLFYRARVRQYLQDNRTDLDHIAAFTLSYAFNDYISARLIATYGRNNSSLSANDYTVFNGGVGLNVLLKF